MDQLDESSGSFWHTGGTRGARARPVHGHVYIGAHDATFIGLAAEHEIGNDSHGNREYDGWYTVAWTRDGAT